MDRELLDGGKKITIFVILLMVQKSGEPLDMVNIALFAVFYKSQLFQDFWTINSIWICLIVLEIVCSFLIFCFFSWFGSTDVDWVVFILHRSSMKFSCDHLSDEFVKPAWLDYRCYRIHVWYIFTYIYLGGIPHPLTVNLKIIICWFLWKAPYKPSLSTLVNC